MGIWHDNAVRRMLAGSPIRLTEWEANELVGTVLASADGVVLVPVATELLKRLEDGWSPVVRVQLRTDEDGVAELVVKQEAITTTLGDVKWTPEDVIGYLDEAILKWRHVRDEEYKELETAAAQDEQRTLAGYYIDAFQSVRMSLFGALLP